MLCNSPMILHQTVIGKATLYTLRRFEKVLRVVLVLWSRRFLVNLTVAYLIKKLHSFFWNLRFITVFTTASCCS
jgi:hypothetical protein